MADQNKVLGADKKVKIFLEDGKLGRDFSLVKNWNRETTYYEWDDEYLGDGDVEPGQRPKGCNFSFDCDNESSDYIDTIMDAIAQAELTGTRPKIEVLEFTTKAGVTSQVRIRKCVLKPKFSVGGHGEKVVTGFTGRGVVPEKVA